MLCDEQNWSRLHFMATNSPIKFHEAQSFAKLLGRSSHAPRIFPIKVVWSRNSPADPRWSTLSSRLTPRFHDVRFLVTLNGTSSAEESRWQTVGTYCRQSSCLGKPRSMSIHLHNVETDGYLLGYVNGWSRYHNDRCAQHYWLPKWEYKIRVAWHCMNRTWLHRRTRVIQRRARIFTV